MLKFFRTYQKGIFVVVAFMVIVSFVFLGTGRSNIQPAKVEKQTRSVGKAIDGSSIAFCDIMELIRVLETDQFDPFIFEEDSGINLLNDGVLKKEILGTGIGKMLLLKYRDQFEDTLAEKIKNGKKYQFYTHPVAEGISQESVIKQFAPEVIGQIEKLKSEKECYSEGALDTYIDLYLSGMKISPYLVRQFLSFQEQQSLPEEYRDHSLRSRTLALFNTKSAGDWFGREFIENVALLIYNLDVYAQQNGISVSNAEVRASLMTNAKRWNDRIGGEKDLTNDQLDGMIEVISSRIGLSEKEMIAAWKRVLSFRHVISQVEKSLFVDTFMCEQKDLETNGYQLVKARLYRLPETLRMTEMKDLWKLQIYLDALTKSEHMLEISDQYKSVEQVAKKFPELVQRNFSVSVVHVRKGDVAESIPLKEMWKWQLVEGNWKKLVTKFPELVSQHTIDQDSRYEYLEGLPNELRMEVDQFSRNEILGDNPDLIRKKLAQTSPDIETWPICLKRNREVVKGINDRERIVSLLLEAGSNDEGCSKVQDLLSCYSEDGENYYRIKVYSADPELELLTYQDASSRGILDELFEKRIKVIYDLYQGRRDSLVLDKNTYPKEMKEVEIALGEISFKGLLEELKAEKVAYNLTPDQFVPLRFFKYLKKQKQTTSTENQNRSPLEMQFDLVEEVCEISNQKKEIFSDPSMFENSEKESSGIYINHYLEPYFYEIVERGVDRETLSQDMSSRRKTLVEEAQRNFVAGLVEKIEIPESLGAK